MSETIKLFQNGYKALKNHIGIFISITTFMISTVGGAAWWVVSHFDSLDNRIIKLEEQIVSLDNKIKLNRSSMKSVWERYGYTNDRITDLDVNIKVNQKTIDILTENKLDIYNPNEVVTDIQESKEFEEVEQENLEKLQRIGKEDMKRSVKDNYKQQQMQQSMEIK